MRGTCGGDSTSRDKKGKPPLVAPAAGLASSVIMNLSLGEVNFSLQLFPQGDQERRGGGGQHYWIMVRENREEEKRRDGSFCPRHGTPEVGVDVVQCYITPRHSKNKWVTQLLKGPLDNK